MITIEMTNEQGYSEKEYSEEEAIPLLNQEIENKRTIWIDGRPFSGDVLRKEDLELCKKGICVTNRLVGG